MWETSLHFDPVEILHYIIKVAQTDFYTDCPFILISPHYLHSLYKTQYLCFIFSLVTLINLIKIPDRFPPKMLTLGGHTDDPQDSYL